MRFLIRAILLFFVVSALLSVIRSAFNGNTAPRRPRPEPQPEPDRPTSGKLVKDPVCGTYILESAALRGRDAFFCSEECRKKYAAG